MTNIFRDLILEVAEVAGADNFGAIRQPLDHDPTSSIISRKRQPPRIPTGDTGGWRQIALVAQRQEIKYFVSLTYWFVKDLLVDNLLVG